MLVLSLLSKSFRHVCLKESSSDFTILTAPAVSDFTITDSVIQAKSSYFWGVTSLSGCEEDSAKRHFFQSSTIYWAEKNSRFIMLLKNNERAILNLVIWLGPGRQRLALQWLNCLCVLSKCGPVLVVYAPLIVFWAGRWCCLKKKTWFYSIIQTEDGGMERQPTANWMRAVWKISTEP